MDMEQARIACLRSALNPDDFSCVQIVYGAAGEEMLGARGMVFSCHGYNA